MHDDQPTVALRTTEHANDHSMAALSATVLWAARVGYGESPTDFACRAGVASHVVKGAEDGSRPAWVLPYPEFAALADAAAVLNPSLRSMFETAAACDLLLTCVLDGDQVLATDVGEFRVPGCAGHVRIPVALHEECGGAICPACGQCLCEADVYGCGHSGQLLSDAQLVLLRRRATELARSGSPDAWAGAELLAVLGGGR
jgi:hypothetical protein